MRLYLLAFLFSFQWATAQDGKGPEPNADYKGPCVVTFPKIKITANNADVVQKFVTGYIANLKQPDVSIRISYVKESPGGFHYSFCQTYRGVEVYQSEIKVNTDRNNVLRSVLDNSFDTHGWNVDVSETNSQSVIALDENGRALLAERKVVNHIERITANEELIYERDTRSYFAAPDSLISGKIFNPDPITTIGQTYTFPPGGIYHDAGDTNTVWLNGQLQTVNFRVNYTGGNFILEDSFIRIADIDSPTVVPVTAATPMFNFNRSQTGFEDVNAFYHLNTYRNYVSSLGYTMADNLVTVDPHAWGVTGSYSDQSSFSPGGGNPELLYGMGGVDDAEDADVLIHEYGHFLSYNASPGSNSGSQRSSLDEAFGDYLAASYSASLSGYNKEWVFNWDGPPWSNNNLGGRTVATTLTYNDLSGSIYKNAPIWSTALMNIHNEIGRTLTDKLIFETHYSYAANMLMSDAALLLIDADTILNNGAYYCPIYKHLFARALPPFSPGNVCKILSVDGEEEMGFSFTAMGNGFRVLNTLPQKLQGNIFTVTGRLVSSFNSNEPVFDYKEQNLAAGVYLVEISNGNSTRTFKWCKTY